MPYGLTDEVLSRITGVFACHPEIKEVILYGSRAKGDYRTGSDIDLTFTGGELTLAALNRIDNELDELLLPYSFDLSILAQIDNARLLEHIERAGKLVYRRVQTPG